ncbi:hypothetical protein HPB50_013725 [Hyalomma asiaticum]|uniref:Uncharacterized protein n=1 Tax=Hyalomma asiaticum TaxID=266040 RepID=A0ACB7TK21_HYAAI|nr:hypothetical protein HPB50_013725 [Hyalomma asiaticum]
MYFAIRPPPFLHAPGVPVIPWPQWRRAFQTYIDAAARDAVSEHKKALLLNALGVEGLLCYLRAVEEEPQPGDYRKASEDAYTSTLLQLDGIFNPQQFSCVHVGTVFSRRVQDGVPARRSVHGNGQHGGLPPRATSSARAGSCFRCGSSQHWADSGVCPARSRTCARCGKRGHFGKVCRSSGDPPAASSAGPSTVTVQQEDAITIPAASPSSPDRIQIAIPSGALRALPFTAPAPRDAMRAK